MAERRQQNAIQLNETSAERAFRLRQQGADARLRRWKEKAEIKMELRMKASLFWIMLGIGAVIGVVCIWIILKEGASPNAVNWATSTLTSLATGVTGYLTGRNSRRD